MHGCIKLGAVGDAYGYVIEFEDIYKIFEKHGGPMHFADLDKWRDRDGRYIASDDTQMTLFTAEGIAIAYERREEPGDLGKITIAEVRQAYLRWYETQRGRSTPSDDKGALSGHPEMFFPRAPGNTCLAACREGAGAFTPPGEPVNDSMGCGGVMRVAPVAFLKDLSFQGAYELGCATAALTHGHPMGWMPSGMLAYILKALSQGATVLEATNAAIDHIKHLPHGNTLIAMIDRALVLSGRQKIAPQEIEMIGGGWVGHECLAISLAAAMMDAPLKTMMTVSANHSGDSDSTAAITGQLIGAQLGLSGIRKAWSDMDRVYGDLDLKAATDMTLARFQKAALT
ncbi:ADP-ribosylglycohydrolase family protein [Rhizobium sp. MHM7A]|uniref:ADP-ribosylglycohydrolase family protein n=1 Tax=Rhizobium sp. MHM7A TaxID=2583233 RepID=UPI0014875AB3|nr:ADP-ribosylglycohydrolase family protein [Rhizobium sp. MHM7A]